MVIPQTRQPIQLFLQKGLAMLSPSVVKEEKRVKLTDYDWQLIDENGTPYNFADAKGKVVLVNFWATWCPPCIAEMPSMEKLYKDYKDEVVFLFVSNEEQKVISNFKHENHYDFLTYTSISANPELLNVSTIPRTFLLDKEGHMVIDKSGAADWNSKKVRNVLDKLLTSE